MKKYRKEHTNLRYNILTIIVYIIGIILISRLFELQIIHGEEYRETSNTRLSRESILEPSRGEIFDRSGNVLATTTSSFNVELYKTKIDNETLNNCILNLIKLFENYEVKYPNNLPIKENGEEFSIEGEELEKWLSKNKFEANTSAQDVVNTYLKKYKINNENKAEALKILALRYEITSKGYSSTKSLQIAENVSRDVVAQISERNLDFPGVTITTKTSRKYNYNNLASHIIGYIGKISEKEYQAEEDAYNKDDYVGKTGIEGFFEKYLRGKKRKTRN